MRRVPLVVLLFTHIAGPDLGRIPDPHFLAHLLQHLHQPLRVTRGFQPNQRRHRQLPVPSLRFAVAVLQLRFSAFSALAVAPSHLLPAGMKITSYNPHRRLLPSPASFLVLYRKRRLRIGASLRPYPISSSSRQRTRVGAMLSHPAKLTTVTSSAPSSCSPVSSDSVLHTAPQSH